MPLALCLLLFSSCGSGDAPLDADTRQRIDSLSNVRIRDTRRQLDSLCTEQQKTVLPLLMDSIKKERLREIQEQMKTVPK